MMGFLTVPRLAFGPGAIEQLSGLDARRALVVVDPEVARRGRERRIVEELAKTDTSVETWVAPATLPAVPEIDPGVARADALQPDWIVAVGGGTTIDAAKGVWVRYENPQVALPALTPLLDLGLRRRARFVAVPTTSGSGAEASWTASFRRDGDLPLEVASRELVSDWALLDPSLASTVPAAVAADAAAEVLGHAFEAIASEWAHPFSDAFAREALAAALPAVARRSKRREDDEAGASLHYAATMAGIAASNSQVGVAHALAAALASEYPVTFGRCLGVLLPYVLEYNFPVARDRYETLAPVLGAAAVQHRASLPERLRPVLELLGIPETLAGAGIPADALAARCAVIAERAARSAGVVANPRVPSAEELAQLLRTASVGGHVTF